MKTVRALVVGAFLAGAIAVAPAADARQPAAPAAARDAVLPAADPTPTLASAPPAVVPAAAPTPTPTPTPTPPPAAVAIRQQAVSYDPASNKETVSVGLAVSNVVTPFQYAVSVRGALVTSGSSGTSPVTVTLLDNCSITTQSITVAITDAAGATAAGADTLDHSLCPPPPDVPHARDHIIAGPTLTRASFIDRLRAMGSPTLSQGGTIYDTMIGGGVNPAFALGTFHAESHSGTRGYARVTKNWGNILYRAWTVKFGATPYSPGNGYTYAKFPSWLAGVRAYVDLVQRYDAGGYVTVSQASAHWLGTHEGTTRHLTYLNNITHVMSILPDDAVPVMVTLAVPARAKATFTVSWRARDNLLVAGYQVRTKRSGGSWSAPEPLTARSRSFTLANGTWAIAVRATDAAGNWSRWKSDTVVVDGTAPEMLTLAAPRLLRAADAVVRATWSASDNRAVTGYEVRLRKGAGTWSAVSATTSASLARRLSPGAWTIGVRARDAVGNRSAWQEALVIVPVDDRAYQFSSGGVLAKGTGYYRGTLTKTASRGATMTIVFTGSAFHLVGTVGAAYGKMTVSIDGVASTVDAGMWQGSRATSTHRRVVLLSRSLAAGDHTAVITNLGTSGRPWIGIDGVGIAP